MVKGDISGRSEEGNTRSLCLNTGINVFFAALIAIKAQNSFLQVASKKGFEKGWLGIRFVAANQGWRPSCALL